MEVRNQKADFCIAKNKKTLKNKGVGKNKYRRLERKKGKKKETEKNCKLDSLYLAKTKTKPEVSLCSQSEMSP